MRESKKLKAGESRQVTVPLMGNFARRGCSKKKVRVSGSVERESFYDSTKVSLATLTLVTGRSWYTHTRGLFACCVGVLCMKTFCSVF